MSFKDYFDKAATIQALSNKSAEEIGAEVESVGYHEQDIIREERFLPRVDYSLPGNFARYGSAAEYYAQSIKRVYEDYPYDGSLQEKVAWENNSTYLDLHIFEQEYPRTNGYIIFSADGYGTVRPEDITDGYGSASTPEYIYFKGGPHPSADTSTPYPTQFTSSNIYQTNMNRESNLKFDLQNKGASVEFWLKKERFIPKSTQKEVIFDLWNGEASSSVSYGRLRIELSGSPDIDDAGAAPLQVTIMSGTTGFITSSIAASTFTTSSIADNKWHHYAFTFKSSTSGITSRLYVDGTLNNETILGSAPINEVHGALRSYVGALIAPSEGPGDVGVTNAGKLSGSLDEFRYWKSERTGQDIGRHWFVQVGGGTNKDPEPFKTSTNSVNTALGVYYKFNEGITGVKATDSVVLDFSGRLSNGAWTGYTDNSRNTGSAIVLSSAAIKEFKDPIIYSFHPLVKSLDERLQLSGSNHDETNNASIYHSIPAWITEEDEEGQKQLKYLTQIMSSYFDTLHLQIESLNKLQTITYNTGSNKPLPFAERLLSSAGLFAPEMFIDADVLEKLADRSEDRVFEKSLEDIKNTIYQNIYNNLIYIYKSKGTEKSFRNLIRCFGIDEELVRLNMYASNIEYEMRSNRRTVSVVDKFINFNTVKNKNSTVFQYYDDSDPVNTTGYFSSSAHLTGGYAQTFEADILFPKKTSEDAAFYFNTNTISASLFGVHGVTGSEEDVSWIRPQTTDAPNFQVYAVRDEADSDNVRFVVAGTTGCVFTGLQSDLYEDVYQNTNWNISVRIKPEAYPYAGLVSSSVNNDYIIELHGVQVDAGIVRNEFTVSETIITPSPAFLTGSKRSYIGAHRTDFTGTILQTSDVKVNSYRCWLDYLDDEVLRAHAYDTQNYGSLQPHFYAYPFDASGSEGDILKIDTLALNWEFSTNTTASATGDFVVADLSSGSAAFVSSSFGWSGAPSVSSGSGFLGPLLGMQYTGKGYDFDANSSTAIDKDFIVTSKLQLPENMQSSDMITVLNAQEQNVFTRESRPINYFFAFEKSMANAVSTEMINYFATLKDMHTIIGAPVNRYRPHYKDLGVLRQRFFERVSNNELDFEKFYEFYKWFDTSLTTMLQQLVPASADIAENVRTVIESHVLERSKYQHKFQNVKKQTSDPSGPAIGGETNSEATNSPEDDLTGASFYSANAYSRRVLGVSQPINFSSWKHIHAPAPPLAPAIGQAVNFDGSNDYLSQGSAGEWNDLIGGSGAAAKPYSISMWIYPDALTDVNPVLAILGQYSRYVWIADGGGGLPAALRITNNVAGNNYRESAANITAGSWQHIVVTFEGGASGASHIYIDGALSDGSTATTTGPDTIGTYGLNIGGYTSNLSFDGKICDVAVWGTELGASDVTQIYADGKRVDLYSMSAALTLVSWWMMGNGDGDSATDLVYDLVSHRNLTFNNGPTITTASPEFATPWSSIPRRTTNSIWWQAFAERRLSTLAALGGGNTPRVYGDRQAILSSVKATNLRALQSPYRFGGGGAFTVGGVGFNQNKRVNFVYRATTPFGTVRNSAAENVIVGFGSGLEKLRTSADVYHPAYRQRLGFKMDPDINRDNNAARKGDGNLFLPFSVYSSSVNTAADATVASSYATGAIITNLHHDLVYDTDIPMQGPFTEKLVGGRQYRHTKLNEGGDTYMNRGEGWKLQFSDVASADGSDFGTPMLGVVPPNYDNASTNDYNKDIPTAHRLRNVGTKRPVNIQNIKMTTSSVDTRLSGVLAHGPLGNYQKNYQIVQSAGRTYNDPFFNDQSFTFALNPETLATRGRFPLQSEPYYTTTKERGPYTQKFGIKMVNNGYGTPFNSNTAAYTASMVSAHDPDYAEYHIVSASVCTVSIWFSASQEMTQDTADGRTGGNWTGGHERTLFWWGGTTPWIGDPGRNISLLSGTLQGLAVDAGPTLKVRVERKGTNLLWESKAGYFANPGWYNVTVGLDMSDPDGDFLLSSATGSSAAGVYINGVTASANRVFGKTYIAGDGYAITGSDQSVQSCAYAIFASPQFGLDGRQFLSSTYSFVSGTLGSVAFWSGSAAGEALATIAPTLTGSNTTGSAMVSVGCRWPAQTDVSGGTMAGPLQLSDGSIYDYDYMTNLNSWWVFPNDDQLDSFNFETSGFLPVVDANEKGSRLWPTTDRGAALMMDTFEPQELDWEDSGAWGGYWTNTYENFGACMNVSGSLNYLLPERTGSNSNQSIIVNRFAGCGYEVMSLGYMDPAHEELSVYNALPYRNLAVIDYGLSGSASVDISVEGDTLTVRDQIDKLRGLDQRASLHCGPFGSDAAYGSVPELTYVTIPSWHKTNRNRRRRIQNDLALSQSWTPPAGNYTASVYDNLFVQHAIPRSTQQYSWVTASLAEGQTIYGLATPSFISASTLNTLITASAIPGLATTLQPGCTESPCQWYTASFVGLRHLVLDPVTASTRTLGYPLTPATGADAQLYINSTTLGNAGAVLDYGNYFNVLTLNRNGPYGYPSWKQIRTGEHPVARRLRKENQIGCLVPPAIIPSGPGTVQGQQANEVVLYTEQPISYGSRPIVFAFRDNSPQPDSTNNILAKATFNLNYFTNAGLNNRLGLRIRPAEGSIYNTLVDFTLGSDLSALITYGEKIYPSAVYDFQPKIRTRENYDISNIWNSVRALRSLPPDGIPEYQAGTWGAPSSTGFIDVSASIWPGDAQTNFYTTGSQIWFRGAVTGALQAGLQRGSGELMNTYARFGYSRSGSVRAAPAYVMPFQMGSKSDEVDGFDTNKSRCTNYCIINAVTWSAPQEAGLNPYQPYIDYAQNIRLLGKDMSIVPEFRISELMNSYVATEGGNFLTRLDNMFNLTGAAIPNSSVNDFYKVYSTADFLRYFHVVDDDLADQTNAASISIRRESIELTCDALLQFLPYKGFYPIERTQELAALFSQSLGPMELGDDGQEEAVMRRILYEPLMAPGILFNTIKSGIACSNFVVLHLSGTVDGDPAYSLDIDPSCVYPLDDNSGSAGTFAFVEGALGGLATDSKAVPKWITRNPAINSADHGPGGYVDVVTDIPPLWYPTLNLAGSSSAPMLNGYWMEKVPFEAIRDPEKYLGRNAIENERLFDTGQKSSSLSYQGPITPAGYPIYGVRGWIKYSGIAASPLYKLGIDNFLCETYNFFMPGPERTSFLSLQEEDFQSVEKDKYYGLQVKLAVPALLDAAGSSTFNLSTTFGMYSRASAFGPPATLSGTNLVGSGYPSTGAPGHVAPIPDPRANRSTTFEHVLPPSYYGQCTANIIVKAPFTGKIDLDTLLSNASIEYHKNQLNPRDSSQYVHTYDYPDRSVVQAQIDSSVDLLAKHLVVPDGTTGQAARWLIRPKFETPVLNFAATTSPSGRSNVSGSLHNCTGSNLPSYWPLKNRGWGVRGMWHQYGNKLSGSEGLYLSVGELPAQISSSAYGPITVNSLTDVVGFDTVERRIGDFAEEKKIWEAIVCIPFLTDRGQRKFFDIEMNTQEYVTQLALLNKYVFPPTFDFLINPTVNPIAFYAFEYSMKLSQDDLINIWQNLPPSTNSSTKFERKTATIRIQALVDRLLETEFDLQWMVFKVKRRAEKDYNVLTRKKLGGGMPIIQPSINSPYSYNWPYDYFSFVELIKIDENLVYATEDLIPATPQQVPVIPDLREFIPSEEEISISVLPSQEVIEMAHNPPQKPPRHPTNLRRGELRAAAAAVDESAIPRPSRRPRARPTRRGGRPRRGTATTRSIRRARFPGQDQEYED